MRCIERGSGLRSAPREIHHGTPRYLLRLHEKAHDPAGGAIDGAGIAAWLEWEQEAVRYRVPVEIGAEELAELVAASTIIVGYQKHREIHQSDFARRGSQVTIILHVSYVKKYRGPRQAPGEIPIFGHGYDAGKALNFLDSFEGPGGIRGAMMAYAQGMDTIDEIGNFLYAEIITFPKAGG